MLFFKIADEFLLHLFPLCFLFSGIGKDIKPVTVFDNKKKASSCLEYAGRYWDNDGYVIIASGYTFPGWHIENGAVKNQTYLIRISSDGSCVISKEWNFMISSANSLAVVNGYAWFGQNKMVTQMNLETGELSYYTNKTDADLADLKKSNL